MDAVHGAADVAGAFAGDEVVEEGEGFDFAAGCIEEGGAEDVHALDVDGGFTCVAMVIIIRITGAVAGMVNDDGFFFFFLFFDPRRRLD